MAGVTSSPATTGTPADPAQPLALDHGPGWANRLALAPLTNLQSHADGTLSEEELRWLTARGEGGFGLTMTCASHVSPAGQAWGGQLGIAHDGHLPGLERLAAALRATGTVSSVQLHHGGKRSDPDLHGGENVSAAADPAKRTRALTTGEVEGVVEDFVAGALRAERAGFDGVEVHGAHGYLLAQFLDPRTNHRDDRYGGDLDGRSCLLREVVEGIRAATGPGFQLGLRLTPEGYGVPLAEGRALAASFLASGQLDYLDLSLWDVFMAPRTAPLAEVGGEGALLIDHFLDLPRGGTRLGVAGKVLSAADVRWCLERGADFVSVGTGAILHHDFARRVVTDAGFAARPTPVTREVLLEERLSPAFVDYLAAGWDDLVA